ncbi:hypothetical protein L7F22_030651 [Adiantum nelumboides]|nr:hypothetical protein [Adiantum nelumboides]
MHIASVDGTQVAWDKLEDFEDDSERAYEWLTNHKGKRRTSCSSRKEVRKLQKACDRLRDAYVAEFEDESSDDDDGWVGLETNIHHVGIPKMEEKEVQKEVGQESLKLPLDTPTLPLECAHRVKTEYPLLKLISVLSLINKIYYSEEKQIIYIEDVVHKNQRPFEEADNIGRNQSKYEGVDRALLYKGNEEEYPKCQILVHIRIEIQIGIQIQVKVQMQIQILKALEIPQWMLRKAKDFAVNDEVIFGNADGAEFYHGDCETICQFGSQADDVNTEVEYVQQNTVLMSKYVQHAKWILEKKFFGVEDFCQNLQKSELMLYDVPGIQHNQRSVVQVSDHGKVKKQIQEDFQELARGQNPLHNSFINLDQKEILAIKFIQEDSTEEFFAINEQAVLSNNRTNIFAMRFVQEDFMKIGAKLNEVHQNLFLTKCYYVHILEGKVKLQESLFLAYYSDRRSQMTFQAFMSHFVEVAEDQNFHFESFKDVILMANAQFNFGDVLVVESGANLIGLWSTLGKNGSNTFCFKSIQLVVWQEQISYYYAACLQDQFVSKMFSKIKLDSKRNSEDFEQVYDLEECHWQISNANSYSESDADAYADSNTVKSGAAKKEQNVAGGVKVAVGIQALQKDLKSKSRIAELQMEFGLQIWNVWQMENGSGVLERDQNLATAAESDVKKQAGSDFVVEKAMETYAEEVAEEQTT